MIQPRRSSRHARRARAALHHIVLALVAALTLAATPHPAAASIGWLEFEGAYFSDDFSHQIMWLQKMCPQEFYSWDQPCPFGPMPIFARFDTRFIPGDEKVTQVEVKLAYDEPWGTLPVPGLPAETGRVQVAVLSATVPCNQSLLKDVYVRLRLTHGGTVENHLAVVFNCEPCTPPPEYRIAPPEDEPPWNPFEFGDPLQDLVPPWYWGDDGNMFFSVLSLASPADSMVRLRLTQDLNWPVAATRPDIVRLLPGDTLRVAYRVDFPPAGGGVIPNRFRLQVISLADSNHRGTTSVVAVAGLPSLIAPALAPWGLAIAGVLLSAVAALALRRRRRASG